MSLRARLPLVALVVGAVNGLVFLGFEWVVHHGIDWIWNDVAATDEYRWRVVPLAIALSLVLSLVLRATGTPRWTEPHTDPLAASDPDAPTPTVGTLGTILLVGAASLLAGAALGPEASLIAVATGLGAWAASRAEAVSEVQILVLCSVGALLVAFFGSLVPVVIPLLVLRKQGAALTRASVLSVALAGAAAYGTLWAIQGNDDGWGSIPEFAINGHDYLAALLLGAVAAGVGALLHWLIHPLGAITKRIDAGAPWVVAATIFGAGIGLLYLIGGPTVQFSGSEGSVMLLSGEHQYSSWALVGLAVIKIAVAGWSVTSGYRGGLIFPAIFSGVALGIAANGAFPDLAGPGILLGVVAGLFVEMTSPALGVLILLSLVPLKLMPLALIGAAGAVAGRAALTRIWPSGSVAA